MPESARAGDIEALFEGDASWSRKADALRQVTARLASGEIDREGEQRVGPLIVATAKDGKWEVRKAAALALAELRHVNSDVAQRTLDQLVKDSNRWVSQAAARASRRLRARTERAREWPLTEATQNPTLQHIASQIHEIGLGSMTHASTIWR